MICVMEAAEFQVLKIELCTLIEALKELSQRKYGKTTRELSDMIQVSPTLVALALDDLWREGRVVPSKQSLGGSDAAPKWYVNSALKQMLRLHYRVTTRPFATREALCILARIHPKSFDTFVQAGVLYTVPCQEGEYAWDEWRLADKIHTQMQSHIQQRKVEEQERIDRVHSGILSLLEAGPHSFQQLRDALQLNKYDTAVAVGKLRKKKLIAKDSTGWVLEANKQPKKTKLQEKEELDSAVLSLLESTPCTLDEIGHRLQKNRYHVAHSVGRLNKKKKIAKESDGRWVLAEHKTPPKPRGRPASAKPKLKTKKSLLPPKDENALLILSAFGAAAKTSAELLDATGIPQQTMNLTLGRLVRMKLVHQNDGFWVPQYVIEFDREDDGRWIADIPAIPGVMTYGDTKNEALRAALELAGNVTYENMSQSA